MTSGAKGFERWGRSVVIVAGKGHERWGRSVVMVVAKGHGRWGCLGVEARGCWGRGFQGMMEVALGQGYG
jgi:hypothetical protein